MEKCGQLFIAYHLKQPHVFIRWFFSPALLAQAVLCYTFRKMPAHLALS